MEDIALDLRQLRYFLGILDAGSFSKAAEVLRIAQPSLSQHMLALEEELGVRLFLRHARGVTATEGGRVLREHACVIFQEVERSKQALQSIAQYPSGEIALGLPTSACRSVCMEIIAEAARVLPNVSIEIVEGLSGSLSEWLNTGRLDVAMLYENGKDVRFNSKEILTEQLRVIVSHDHPAAQQQTISFKEAMQLPLVLPSCRHVLRKLLEQHASDLGLEVKVAMNCDSLTGILELVRSGYATIYPSFPMREEISREEMTAISIVDPCPEWRISLAQSRTSKNARAAGAVADLVQHVALDMAANGRWQAQAVDALPAPLEVQNH